MADFADAGEDGMGSNKQGRPRRKVPAKSGDNSPAGKATEESAAATPAGGRKRKRGDKAPAAAAAAGEEELLIPELPDEPEQSLDLEHGGPAVGFAGLAFPPAGFNPALVPPPGSAELAAYLEYSRAAWTHYAQHASVNEALRNEVETLKNQILDVEERAAYLQTRNTALETRNSALEQSAKDNEVRYKKLAEIVAMRKNERTNDGEVLDALEKELAEGKEAMSKVRPRIPVPASYRLAPKKLILMDLEAAWRRAGDDDPAKKARALVESARPKTIFTKFARSFNAPRCKIETTKLHDADAKEFILAARAQFPYWPADAGEVELDLEKARGHGSKNVPGELSENEDQE